MNNEFKRIAKQLGIAIPACLLSIGVANAETIKENEVSKNINAAVSEISKSNLINNDVVKFLTMDNAYNTGIEFGHTNSYSDRPANHTDDHSNRYHTDDHSNRSAYNNGTQCIPHADSHSNRAPENRHTNSGNPRHSDSHTDIPDPVKTCPPSSR